MIVGDIDIDVADREELLTILGCVKASKIDNQGIHPHNTGVYLQDVPVDPVTSLCSIDYKDAESAGYYKIDLLNVGIYQQIKNKEHLDSLLERDIDWSIFKDREFVEQLYHLHNNTDIVVKLEPKSIEDLAAVLAIIRPAKRYLKDSTWNKIRSEVWDKTESDQYYFKKSHALSYAMLIYAQAQLIIADAINDN